MKPSREDFQTVGAFNAGLTRYQNEVLLLLRIAEKPKNIDSTSGTVPIYQVKSNKIEINIFQRNDPGNDFSDSRFVMKPTQQYLSSISHWHVARRKDGIHFEIEAEPALSPANEYELFGIENP